MFDFEVCLKGYWTILKRPIITVFDQPAASQK